MKVIPFGMQPIVTGLMTDECIVYAQLQLVPKNESARKKPVPTPLCQPQIQLRLFDEEL